MCGIIGVTGSTEALDVLIEGLDRLEYRGYDSAGVAVPVGDTLWRTRAATGTRSLDAVRKSVEDAPDGIVAGIGHTRWATHGHPNEENAHPHVDCSGRVAVVHNGIIENHRSLRAGLTDRGHVLESATDTEVVAHLVEERLAAGDDLPAAVRGALAEVQGLFSVAVLWAGDPELIVASRRASPLVVGFGDAAAGEPGLLASDIPALLGRTRHFWVLDDDQVAEIRPGALRVTTLTGEEVSPRQIQVDWDLEHAQKGGFDDFMSKEIHEQPQAVADTLLGRLQAGDRAGLDEVRIPEAELARIDKVFVVACGTSFHAGLVAKYAMEHWARVPVEIDIASEFRYRDPVLDHRTLVIGVSQSGETVDTLQAMRHARHMGARVLVLSNVVDSSMAREADGALYTRAGPEIGVAATKTHLAQVAALEVLAVHLARLRGALTAAAAAPLFEALAGLPDLVATAVGRSDEVAAVAAKCAPTHDYFFLGRHVGLPVAMEGALKLKELAYVRAEAYPAAELKHGPIALIEPGTVVVGVATRTALWEKMMSNIAEVRSRGASIVLVANDGDEETAAEADDVLFVPAPAEPLLSPVVDVVPLQLLAYHVARARGLDMDRPRNLAKTVTVE